MKNKPRTADMRIAQSRFSCHAAPRDGTGAVPGRPSPESDDADASSCARATTAEARSNEDRREPLAALWASRLRALPGALPLPLPLARRGPAGPAVDGDGLPERCPSLAGLFPVSTTTDSAGGASRPLDGVRGIARELPLLAAAAEEPPCSRAGGASRFAAGGFAAAGCAPAPAAARAPNGVGDVADRTRTPGLADVARPVLDDDANPPPVLPPPPPPTLPLEPPGLPTSAASSSELFDRFPSTPPCRFGDGDVRRVSHAIAAGLRPSGVPCPPPAGEPAAICSVKDRCDSRRFESAWKSWEKRSRRAIAWRT